MKCERCGGSGSNNETNPRLRESCPDCNGTGNQPESREKPLQPVKKDYDERIKEEFECKLVEIRTTLKNILRENFYDTRFHPTPANVRIEHLIYDMMEYAFKSRNKEVEKLEKKIKELLSKAEWGW